MYDATDNIPRCTRAPLVGCTEAKLSPAGHDDGGAQWCLACLLRLPGAGRARPPPESSLSPAIPPGADAQEDSLSGASGTTTRRILGSIGIIGAAAAIAGLGTFGTFTDSTSVDTTTTSGTLSIDVGAPGGIKKAIPVLTSGFLPGDSLSRALNLENTGNVALSSVNLANSASPSGPLVTDQVNGLQLTLERCSRAWTASGTSELPTYTCTGTRTALYTGPAITTAPLPAPNSLTPGREDNLMFTLSLPSTAGNDKQALSATVTLAFTAVQAPGTAR